MSWTARGGLAAISTAAVLGTAGVTVAVASENGDDRHIDTSPVTATSGVDTESAGDLSLQISGVLDAALNRTNQLTSQFQTAQQRVALAKQRAAQQSEAQAVADRTDRADEEREAARAAKRTTSSPIPVARVGKDDDADDVAARPGKRRGDHRDARERARDRRTEDRPGRHRGWDRERGWERHGEDGPGRHRGHDRHGDGDHDD
jgi:hypothetical protein